MIAGDTIYFCGQTSRDGGDIKVQTEAVLKKIDDLLAAYGTDKRHLTWFKIILKKYGRFFPELK